ncbi:CRAL-TRIO domain-containing protein [Cynara cardunculus var. scolymus]|uniref:CRAL-TRIO domain-containing protein n=1 Tax=Cynara cardunculus var. scolymus TaxID=59895 RepID=A0A118JXP0_CYNCS|nr:CRAL-TRIO domain-containing protein [Cynara cardunculus var. scolymus]
MLNMPRFFVSVWKMISYFLEKATLHKVCRTFLINAQSLHSIFDFFGIMIVTSEEERKHFVTEVGKEVLPEVFGGEAKFVALQDKITYLERAEIDGDDKDSPCWTILAGGGRTLEKLVWEEGERTVHIQSHIKMDHNQQPKLTQMKNCVQKLGSSTENYGDPTLDRFLIARSMDPNKAAKMFVSWQKWRASFVPLGFIPDSQVLDQLDAEKIYLQGLSKDGYPVVIIKASKHYPAKDQPQFKKFVVHMLDKVIASGIKGKEVGNEKMIGVIDLNQLSYKNVDARGLITGFQFLQAYYPEREVGEDILPEEFGGQAKLVVLQDVILPPSQD